MVEAGGGVMKRERERVDKTMYYVSMLWSYENERGNHNFDVEAEQKCFESHTFISILSTNLYYLVLLARLLQFNSVAVLWKILYEFSWSSKATSRNMNEQEMLQRYECLPFA